MGDDAAHKDTERKTVLKLTFKDILIAFVLTAVAGRDQFLFFTSCHQYS